MFQMYKIILRSLLIGLFIVTEAIAHAQTMRGVVLNSETNHPIPFANIYVVDLAAGTLADSLGAFEIQNFPSSTVTIKISAFGYATKNIEFKLQNENLIEFHLEAKHVHLDEVVVSTPFGKLASETVTNVDSRRLTEINRIPSSSMSEALTQIPGVYQSSTGPGIGKPIIRGLSGTRVVTYLNGMRIENQQWGDDHGMGITDVGIESVEVIKGPASLLYGSDALGGVLFFTNQSYAKLNHFEAYYQGKFESNTLGIYNQIGLKWNVNGLKFNIFAGQTTQADYQLPNQFRVYNSRFATTTLKSSIGYNKKNWVGNFHYSYLQNTVGILGDADVDSVYKELFYSNDTDWKINLPYQYIDNHYFSFENKFFFTHSFVEIILSNTNNRLREFEETTSQPGLDLSLNNSIYNLKWKKKFTRQLETIIGSQGMYQVNSNAQDAEDVLIPNAVSVDAGLYGLLQFSLPNLIVQGGLRYDNRNIKTSEDFNGFGQLNKSYSSFNYAAGFVYSTDSLTVRLNVSSGYRAPHTSELLANGAHHGTFRYNIGDPNLKTENAIQVDFSLSVNYDHLEISFNPFFNQINNYIYLQATDSIIEDYQVFIYTQANKAQLFGGDVTFHTHPHFAHWLHVQSSFSYLFAQDGNENALPFIPQTRINSQIKIEFESSKKFQLADIVLQHSFYFNQNRIGNYETATAAYQVFHLGTNWKIATKGEPILFTVGVKNALNTAYFDHLSRLKQISLEQPGISAYFGLKYSLAKKLKPKHKD